MKWAWSGFFFSFSLSHFFRRQSSIVSKQNLLFSPSTSLSFPLFDPSSDARESPRAPQREFAEEKQLFPRSNKANKTMTKEAFNTGELAAALDDLDLPNLPVDDDRPKSLNDLPNDVLVSIFEAIGDLRWVRNTIPLVCKAWPKAPSWGPGRSGRGPRRSTTSPAASSRRCWARGTPRAPQGLPGSPRPLLWPLGTWCWRRWEGATTFITPTIPRLASDIKSANSSPRCAGVAARLIVTAVDAGGEIIDGTSHRRLRLKKKQRRRWSDGSSTF